MKIRSNILLLLCICFFTACSPEPNPDVNIDVLTQYKWYAHFENIDLSDDYDYAWMQKGHTYLFFLADGTGRDYTWERSEDSDGDVSRGGDITRFSYTVSGNIVNINYRTYTAKLRLEGKELIPIEGGDVVFSEVFKAQNITADDYKYIPRTGICGEKLTYIYENDTYELKISGTGDMYDYTSTNQPWHDFYVSTVIVEDGVTSIGKNAFVANSLLHIDEVELPYSLLKIGNNAFSGTFLTNIVIPDNVNEIGDFAFTDCKYLKNVSISNNNKLEKIGEWVFSGCDKLSFKGLSFNENLRTIGNNAFSCSIGDLKFKEGVESIGHGAFAGGVSNKELILPNTLKTIGSLAFDGGFSKIVIGTGLQELGTNAFVSSAKSGELYINIGTPLTVDGSVIQGYNTMGIGSNEKNWTLYVPKGCKSAYLKQAPWNKFKAIVEDGELDGENENDDKEEDDVDNSEYSDLRQDRLDADNSRRGQVAKGFSRGTGTSTDPYIILSAAELRFFSDAVRNGNLFKNQYVKLGADITINQNVLTRYGELNGDGSNFEPWIPIGRYDPSYFFCGTFDGNGYTISGLYCNRPEGEDVGLFGKLYGNVNNVIIKDSYFKGKNNVGGVAGNTRPNYNGSTIPTSVKEYYQNEKIISITLCMNEAMVSGESQVGGIIGYSDNEGKISKCINSGYIIGNTNVGGIIGKSSSLSSTSIIDCCNKGYVRGILNDNTSIGGVLGNGYSNILNCLNLGDVKNVGRNAGGICGIIGNTKSRKITNCVNISIGITATHNVGAIVGLNNGITVSYNYYIYQVGMSAIGDNNGSNSNNNSLTDNELKSVEFLNKLNSKIESSWSKWKVGNDGYLILEWME